MGRAIDGLGGSSESQIGEGWSLLARPTTKVGLGPTEEENAASGGQNRRDGFGTFRRGHLVIVAAALAAAASAAGAATPDSGWRALDDLAVPAVAAIADAPGLSGEALAWGDPSAGCFGVVQELRTEQPIEDPTRAIAAVHASLHDALVAGGATFESWTAERGVSTGVFRRGDFDAQTRTIASIDPTGALSVRSAVCFYNERDAERSRDQCRRFLETL